MSWSSPESLGGYTTGDPSVGMFQDGRLAVFVIGGFFDVYYKVQQSPGSREWSDWIHIPGGYIKGNIAVGSDADGKLEIFARGGDNSLWTNMQTAPNSNTWTGWTSLGGFFVTDPVVVARELGNRARLVLFAQGAFFDGYYQEQGSTSGGWTNNWKPLAGYITSRLEVTAGPSLSNIYVLARGGDNALWYGIYDGQIWRGWTSLGGYVTSDIFADTVLPSVLPGGGCNVQVRVYAAGGDHSIYYRAGELAC